MPAVTTAPPRSSLAMPPQVRRTFRDNLRSAGLEPRSPSPSPPRSPPPSPPPVPPAPELPASPALFWQPRAGRWLGLVASGAGLWLGASAVRPDALAGAWAYLPPPARRPLMAVAARVAGGGLLPWTVGVLWASSRAAQSTRPAPSPQPPPDGRWLREALHVCLRGVAAGAAACVLGAIRFGYRRFVPVRLGLCFVAAAGIGLERLAGTEGGGLSLATEMAALALATGVAVCVGPQAAGASRGLKALVAAALAWQAWAAEQQRRQAAPAASPVMAGMRAAESAVGAAWVMQLVGGA